MYDLPAYVDLYLGTDTKHTLGFLFYLCRLQYECIYYHGLKYIKSNIKFWLSNGEFVFWDYDVARHEHFSKIVLMAVFSNAVFCSASEQGV